MIGHHGRPTPPPKNGSVYEALIYKRVSIAEERTGGHTLDTQQERLQEQFDALYGRGRWNLTVLEDDGVSGRYGTHSTRSTRKVRKGLLAAAQLLDTGKFDDFAVYNLSRLARDNVITEEFLKEHVVANGTTFHSATEDVDLTTPQGWLVVRIITAVNANQREGIAERNKDAAAMRVQEGYYMGQVGYGWQWEPLQAAPTPMQAAPAPPQEAGNGPPEDGGGRPGNAGPGKGKSRERRRILPIPEQGEWITWMKDRYLAGWSPRKLAGELNALGVPPPEAHKGRSGAYQDAPASGKWNGDVLLRILLSPTHAGQVMTKAGLLIEGEFFAHRYFEPEGAGAAAGGQGGPQEVPDEHEPGGQRPPAERADRLRAVRQAALPGGRERRQGLLLPLLRRARPRQAHLPERRRQGGRPGNGAGGGAWGPGAGPAGAAGAAGGGGRAGGRGGRAPGGGDHPAEVAPVGSGGAVPEVGGHGDAGGDHARSVRGVQPQADGGPGGGVPAAGVGGGVARGDGRSGRRSRRGCGRC